MPKLRESPAQRMDKAFLAALRYGQTMKGETNPDTMRLMTVCPRSFYRRLKDPGLFSVTDVRILAQRYFNDRQLCEMFGVEYHGSTP